MTDMQTAMNLLSTPFSTSIIRYTTGKFGLVGNVPGQLTGTWDTESQVISALLEIGITRFQLADCSWYRG